MTITLIGHPNLQNDPTVSSVIDVLVFAIKGLLIVGFIVGGIALILRSSRSSQLSSDDAPELRVHALNQATRQRIDKLELDLCPEAERKALVKAQRRRQKDMAKVPAANNKRPRAFVLDFEGDLRASAVSGLRDEITALLQIAGTEDEVVVRLESPGGMVHSYGLAASQLARIRSRGIRLTAVVDRVAASGGYMMACVADRIIAAPFAIIGSIGVVMQLPNFNRLLKNKDIDFELLTAGEHKRTLTLFGENTEPARAKALEELEDTHTLFKEFIASHRPQLDVDKVASGEHWFGTRALALNLVDELRTSDDYLMQLMDTHDVFTLHQQRPKPLIQRLVERFNGSRLSTLWALVQGRAGRFAA